jgi:hypothetical protein
MEQGGQSNFNVVTTSKSNKGGKTALIIGAIVVLFLAISIPAGVYLVKQQQNIKEKAASALVCPAAEACPVSGQTTLLRSCYSSTTGDAPQEISCSTIANVGTTALCGASKYCCPSLGAAWTTDLTLCATPSPTPTLTPTPTATATSSATPTGTATGSATPTSTVKATATATSSATAVPIPVTGTNWPTVVGAGVGILIIVGSILLVL